MQGQGRDWTVPGSRARIRAGQGAAVALALPVSIVPGPWIWFFMTPLLWGIWGAGWKQRIQSTALWGGSLLILICYPLLHIDPASFLYAMILWAVFYLLLGLLLIPWGRAEKGNPVIQVISPAIIWLGLSRLFSANIPPGDFWLIPAMAAPWPGEVVSFIGAWGLSALMLTAGSALALLATGARKTGLWSLAVIGFLLVALTVAAPDNSEMSDDPVSISLLQGDFGRPWEERVALLDSLILPAYLELYTNLAHKSTLVVAPEYALPVALEDYPEIIQKVQSFVDSFDTPFLIGAEGLVEGKEDKFYNMAWMFRPGNPPEGQPAPFPAPYTLHETVPGPGPASFTDPVQMGILLCFDLTNPGLVRELASGNDLLVMMTNLQGFDRTTTKRILRGLAQLRAAEAGRYMAIASNTGPTGIIDPSGRVVEWSADGRQSVTGTIWLTKRPSWYVIKGYWVLWVVWAIGFAFSAWNVYPRRKKGGNENER